MPQDTQNNEDKDLIRLKREIGIPPGQKVVLTDPPYSDLEEQTPAEVRDVAAKMLGQVLVTHQTGPAGRLVNKVLVAESANIAREIYFAVLLDRATAAPVIVASTEGGVEIEAKAGIEDVALAVERN